jgi:antitoxin ParD1/3/4
MKTLNIALPDALKAFVLEQVEEGGYNSASEYIQRLVSEDHDRKYRDSIDSKLLESLDSGRATPMTAGDWEKIRRQVRERAAKRAGKA